MSTGSGVNSTLISAFSPDVLLTTVQLLSVGAEELGVVICVGSGERKVTFKLASSPTHNTMLSHTLWLVITGGTFACVWLVVKLRYL